MRLKRAHGFTLIEFLVVIIIISTLGAVLLDRMLFYQEAAEKAAMEQIAGTLRSALHLQIADKLVKGQIQAIPHLAEDNPMDWLAEQPANYVGERFAPQASEVPKGSWYYDLKDRQLVYVVSRDSHFAPNKQGRKEVRYAVRVVYAQQVAQAGQDIADNQEVNGVLLALVEPYMWF